MPKVNRLMHRLIVLLICALSATCPGMADLPSSAPFTLIAWPTSISVQKKQAVNVFICLQNNRYADARTRVWFTPVTGQHQTDLHCLVMRCTNLDTRRDARYTGYPPGKTVADGLGTESTYVVPPGCFVGASVDMAQFCDLSPGNYRLQLYYDTSFTPSWLKPDKRAWHGVTNTATITIHVSK